MAPVIIDTKKLYNEKGAKAKGRIIKYMFKHPESFPDASDGGYDPGALDSSIGNIGDALTGDNSTPTKLNALQLKQKILTSYGYLLNGLNTDFNKNVTDSELGNVFNNLDSFGGTDTFNPAFYGFKGTNDREKIDVGLGKLDQERKLKQQAITTPDSYVQLVNDDLASIDEQAFTVYQKSYYKYNTEYKYPSDEAKKLAINDMNVYKSVLMKQHDAVFNNKESNDPSVNNRDYKNAAKRIIKQVV